MALADDFVDVAEIFRESEGAVAKRVQGGCGCGASGGFAGGGVAKGFGVGGCGGGSGVAGGVEDVLVDGVVVGEAFEERGAGCDCAGVGRFVEGADVVYCGGPGGS